MTCKERNASPSTRGSASPQGTILVAGAGYLGTELLQQLCQQGCDAWGLRRGRPDGGNPARILHCDITDPADLIHLGTRLGRIEVVIHCASSGHGGAEAYRRIFIDATTRLLEILAPAHFLFVGSTSVLPQVDGSPVDEQSPVSGMRETSRILLEAEQLVLDRAGTVLRSSGLYGPGRSVILERFLLGEAGIDSEGPAGTLSDGRLINQIHRDDAAAGIAFLLGHRAASRGETYHLSDGHPMSQCEVYRGLVARLGGSLPPRRKPSVDGKRAWTNKAVSSAKLQALGWRPRYPDYLAAIDEDPRLLASIRARIPPRPTDA